MIKNERQYRITKSAAEQFELALAELPKGSDQNREPNSQLWEELEKNALQSQLDTLHREIEEYELLQSGQEPMLELQSLDELPKSLIRARIAAGLTQKELAARLGLPEQQVQRYEATEYASANLTRVLEVTHALGMKVREKFLVSVTPVPRQGTESTS
jgi:ribosome-binding protein aMBF1 (putative translation factor)